MRHILRSGYFAFDQTQLVEVEMLQVQYRNAQHVGV